MQEALADFRIESDAVIWLSFVNGATYRVNPDDLEHYLERDDLLRIRRAISLRNQFMRRVLPPTIMVLLAVGIIGLGGHDMQRVEALSHPQAKLTTHCIPAQTVPASGSSKSPAKASTVQAMTAPSIDSSGSAMVAQPQAIKVSEGTTNLPVAPSKVSGSAPVDTGGVTALTNQLPLGVGQVVTPVTQAVQPVTQVVAPVTTTARHLLGGL
jgi:hypothetical protein